MSSFHVFTTAVTFARHVSSYIAQFHQIVFITFQVYRIRETSQIMDRGKVYQFLEQTEKMCYLQHHPNCQEESAHHLDNQHQ